MSRDGAQQLLVFRTGRELFGLELSGVHEVVDAPVLSRVPEMPPTVLGVVSVRGELITVYDPTPLLTPAGASGHTGAALLFTHGDRRIALAVDDVMDAVSIDDGMLRGTNGVDAGDRLVRGIVRRGSDLIVVLDVEVLVESAAAQATVGGGGGGRP
jgi:purine-binding chemotaxis protein CheW